MIELKTARLTLTLPPPTAAELALDYFERNREHLTLWSPTPSDGFYTQAF